MRKKAKLRKHPANGDYHTLGLGVHLSSLFKETVSLYTAKSYVLPYALIKRLNLYTHDKYV